MGIPMGISIPTAALASEPGADPGFDKGGTLASTNGARAYNGGLGSKPPAGSRGRAPAGVQRGEASLKLKAFCPFSYKREAKSSGFK